MKKEVVIITILAAQLLAACSQSGQARKKSLEQAFPQDTAAINKVLEDEKLTKLLGAEAKDLYKAEEQFRAASKSLLGAYEYKMNDTEYLNPYKTIQLDKLEYFHFNPEMDKTSRHNFLGVVNHYSSAAQELMQHIDNLERMGFHDLANRFRKLMEEIQKEHLKIVSKFVGFILEVVVTAEDYRVSIVLCNSLIELYKAYANTPGNEKIMAVLAGGLTMAEGWRRQERAKTGQDIQFIQSIPTLIQ